VTDLPQPPVAATRSHEFTTHGVTISDPWAWLKDPNYPTVSDKDVLAYLEAENAYFEAQMAPHKPLTDRLYEEMKGRRKMATGSIGASSKKEPNTGNGGADRLAPRQMAVPIN